MTGKSGLLKILLLEPLKRALGVIKNLDPLQSGQANTAFIWHRNALLALFEVSQPFKATIDAKTGKVGSVGYETYGGQLAHPMSAHPKVDHATGEMLFFGYNFQTTPYISYSVLDSEGQLVTTVGVDVPVPIMMHDFAITEMYAVFMDLPLQFVPKKMVKEGTVFFFNKTAPARLGLLPRRARASSEMRWFALPEAFMSFHTMAAWEEGDTVVLLTFRQDEMSLGVYGDENAQRVSFPKLWKITLNTVTGAIAQSKMSDLVGEFPRVNEATWGTKTRFGWFSLSGDDKTYHGATMHGVVKIDLESGEQLGRIDFDGWGGETVFAPKEGASAEDDGYLMNIVRDPQGQNALFVWDAKTMEPEAVAKVQIPGHVPFGFHTAFVPQSDLDAAQKVQDVKNLASEIPTIS